MKRSEALLAALCSVDYERRKAKKDVKDIYDVEQKKWVSARYADIQKTLYEMIEEERERKCENWQRWR